MQCSDFFPAEVVFDFCCKEKLISLELSAMINAVTSHMLLYCLQILSMDSFSACIFKIQNHFHIVVTQVI